MAYMDKESIREFLLYQLQIESPKKDILRHIQDFCSHMLIKTVLISRC